ncbi:hypothetical protein TVAG_084870 [Trichomonas vaginalis G3]|uniref:Uncharacterized protein n=1 Tax=Trichomonas vaginalis (strain ATCC PRA-98 / G3) TaxID=412133 RepID=A2F3S8_TRIV3|nr:guanylate cyclase protein [Trichomonas vaginalis G3]EAY00450.1 hypothetical protein TVAG_084870 [Trichomonas vaginalis G3]KAI5493484.1 guanylate cyclase protein [Trichomonas vaginalis G3]|eukprot:XP_001313379.1 hypothetical protein [Trichomonas vaginalis G3]
MFYSPRIMFLADITLNWNSLSSMLITLCNGLLSMLTSASISITDSKISILFATLIITYLQLFLSVYLFVNVSFINRKIGSIYSGILFGCGAANIVNIIAVYKTINYTIIFFATILLVIASVPIFLMISNKIVQKALTRISFVDNENQKQVYNKADEFISDVKLTIEFCPLQVFSWTLYEFFLELEPRNNDLILLYCRLISAFPRYQYHLDDVAKFMNYSTLKLRRIYFLQLSHIIRHRHTTTTTEVISFFNDYDNQNRTLQLLTQKFWENVLSENRSAFWTTMLDYNKEIKNMEVLVRQAINDFENSPEVISQAIRVYQTVTFNFHQANKHSDELKLLMSGVPAHPDRALPNILSVFPMIGGISADVVQDIEISGHAIDMHDIDSDLMQRKEVVYDLLSHQKVGQIWLQVIYFILASVLLVVFGSVYISKLSSTVVNEITQTSDFMIEASTLLHVFSRYALFKSFNKGLYHTKDTPMSNSDETMKQISPNWYPEYLSKYDPSDTKMASLEYSLKKELGLTVEKLRELDQTRENVKVFNDRFLVEQFEPYNYTLNELMVNIFSYEKLDLTFLQMTKTAFTYLKDIIAEFADATDFTNTPLSINILMILTLLIDLLVYCLPMVLYYFLIHVQMEDICSMYFSLPMSEVKKIIGDQTKAKKENSLAMTLISSSDNKFLNFPMAIVQYTLCVACSLQLQAPTQ